MTMTENIRMGKMVRRRIVRTAGALLGIAWMTAGATDTAAQNSTASPYSIYGIGTLMQKEDATSTGMGHAGLALSPSKWLNVSNPAGIGNLDTLSFYFNFQLRGFYAHNETWNEQQSVYSGNIDGIAMGFRARKWLGIAFGYAPVSGIGYNLKELRTVQGANDEYYIRASGQGGLQQAYLTGAFTPVKGLTIGASLRMLWGSIKHKEIAELSTTGGEDMVNERKYTLNNLDYELGIQYGATFGKNTVRVGAVFSDKRFLHQSYDHDASNAIVSNLMHDDDTPLRTDFYMPRSYGVGLSYSRGRLLGAIDYKKMEWSKTKPIVHGENIRYKDCYSIGGGLQFSAGNPNDPFYKRIQYRVGYYYATNYIKLHEGTIRIPNTTDGTWGNGEFIPNNGSASYYYFDTGRGKNYLAEKTFTLGFSVPVGRSANILTFAFERTERGTERHELASEKINVIKLAFTVHETWFMKSKFD